MLKSDWQLSSPVQSTPARMSQSAGALSSMRKPLRLTILVRVSIDRQILSLHTESFYAAVFVRTIIRNRERSRHICCLA